MKITAYCVIDKSLLNLGLPTGLVFEHNIIIPPPLDLQSNSKTGFTMLVGNLLAVPKQKCTACHIAVHETWLKMSTHTWKSGCALKASGLPCMTSSCMASCFVFSSSAAFLAASCSRSFLMRASSASNSFSSSYSMLVTQRKQCRNCMHASISVNH